MTQSHNATAGPASITWQRGLRGPVCAAVTLCMDTSGGGAWEAQREKGADVAVICVCGSVRAMNGALCARGERLERVLATKALGLNVLWDGLTGFLSKSTYQLQQSHTP